MTDVKLQDHQSGPVAQSVEHRPFKAGVRGSSPRRITTFFVLNSTAMLSFFVFKVFSRQSTVFSRLCHGQNG